jgi:hypothetical protein
MLLNATPLLILMLSLSLLSDMTGEGNDGIYLLYMSLVWPLRTLPTGRRIAALLSGVGDHFWDSPAT